MNAIYSFTVHNYKYIYSFTVHKYIYGINFATISNVEVWINVCDYSTTKQDGTYRSYIYNRLETIKIGGYNDGL